MGDKQTISVPGRYEKIQQVCQFVAQGAVQAGLTDTAVFHIELACDEACTNVIEHAYGGEDVGEIVVSWQVQGDHFVITIYDHGRPFDPAAVPSPPTAPSTTTLPTADNLTDNKFLETIRIGGLGIHFMRTLMDDVRYHFDDDGNTLTLIKKISPPS